jgi:hypothetical protein
MTSYICYMQILYKHMYYGCIEFYEWLFKLIGG